MKNFQWKNNTVTHMHIELSNLCNAACPFCPRHFRTTPITRPDLQLDQITYEQFVEWFPPEFVKNIYRILFCGTHGDPATAKDLYRICEYLTIEAPKCDIMIHTNGGLRDKQFWQKLGNLLLSEKRGHYVAFSIDGLEDTNHLYRRNVRWKKLMENVKAYTDTGARAYWEYLIFKHNEHQIEEAKNLAKELNFSKFLEKRALGFEKPGGGVIPREVYDKNGNLDYILEAPSSGSLINSRNLDKEEISIKEKTDLGELDNWKKGYNPHVERKLQQFEESNIPEYNRYVKEYENFEIKCKSCATDAKTSEIYVSCNGIVFPCCFVGTRVDSAIDLYEDTQLRHKIRNHGLDHFDLKKHSIFDIIQGGHLDAVYTSNWTQPTIEEGKLSYCAMTCGENSQLDKIYVGND